jgi:hypothetical protein
VPIRSCGLPAIVLNYPGFHTKRFQRRELRWV